jgi:hypothetical protein
VALFDPKTYTPRWIIAAVGALLIIYALWVSMTAERQEQQPVAPKPNQWKKTAALAVLAFAIYIAAIPGTPFLDFSWFDLRIGGAGIIIAAIVLPGLAKRWGVAPST